ncbi:MAG TPA: EAL domain-containing protein [Gammaproteobacteria bacterium]|nr:EAL domain-containing protein [Gammaproteobacteria bacterium]
MAAASQILSENARLLKAKASKYSILGVLIAALAVVIATLISAYFNNGNSLSLEAVISAQKTNSVLWVLDLLPFFFAFWGQYTGSIMAYEGGAMVLDQTTELRTQAATLEQQIAYQSTHDSLTGLPNRTLFTDRLEHALQMVRSEHEQLAVLIMDLDGFKEINDTLGHYNGDRVLKSAATRMQNVVSASTTLARLGGDEFGLILTDLSGPKDLEKVVHNIQKALEPQAVLEGVTIHMAASMGAALAPQHGRDADTLMQRADVAMYVAKDEKRGYLLYSSDLDAHSPQRLTLIGELRQAIQNNDLQLYYQPKVSGVDRQVLGAEALVRWKHARYGLLQPDEFIPMAERTGIIKELSIWVMRNALKDMDLWDIAFPGFVVAINLTAHSLLDPEFPNVVAGLLAAREYTRGTLSLEITESALMGDQERVLSIISQLLEMGIHISIDDFGTGYSSMAYLTKVPVKEIKIDQTFVIGMQTVKNDAIIVNAIIQLAHNLGLTVTAEGVESGETFERLRALGCDAMQGMYISMPMKATELIPWIKDWHSTLQRQGAA